MGIPPSVNYKNINIYYFVELLGAATQWLIGLAIVSWMPLDGRGLDLVRG